MNNVEVRDYSAPLASVTAGRLEFRRGAARVEIEAGPGDDLYRAQFEGRVPEVRVRGGTISVQYHHAGFATAFLFHGGRERAHFTLNESVSWELEFRGGLSELMADLSR